MPVNEIEKYSAIIASPLSIDFDKLPLRAHKRIMLSMGYDLNEFVNEKSLLHLMQHNVEFADLVVIDNPELKSSLITKLGYKGRTYVLPYGCEIHKFAEIPVPNKKNIGTNRSLSEFHNTAMILKVVAELNPDHFGKFVYVAHGADHGDFLKRNERFLKRITYEVIPGGEEDVTKKFLGEIDIFISASRSDGSSVSLLEAMAAQKVCLVTDTPANRYWINDGVNGFCFNNSPEDLFFKIEQAINMTEFERVEMGAKARKRVEQDADWLKNVSEFCDLLNLITKE